MTSDVDDLIARDKRALGRAISLCEDGRRAAAAERAAMIAAVAAHAGRRRARFVGLTGPPGAGKSSLIAVLVRRVVELRPDTAVCVLAVDPSSEATGGALLGDRVRVRFPPDDGRLFFRSQASDLELGGLGRHTFSVCRLLEHLFDCVVVETVGVGQSEIDVHRLADRTYLVLPPHFGDAVQLMKAGIMEIPDAVVLAKQDLPRAADGAGAIEVELARRGKGRAAIPLHRVSTVSGVGVEAIAAEIADLATAGGEGRSLASREPHFFERWVGVEFGRSGRAALEALGGAGRVLEEAGGFDGAIAAFPTEYRRWLSD